ncbi:GGDEF domain-containing protein [Chitinimonas koreensis]|uniref:GGDEF domain-containing protein n=1 Tax=Chitinimonas koreensis TaxID=356302 RepID=UPI000425DBE5|nr:diguanylate cyclase [Chitinimonas koreensis]QNM98372.1 diguanylate cyclase [Chitinimonas koreensis]
MLHLYRTPLILFAALAAALFLLFQAHGAVRPFGDWQWMDIAGEGGTALMAAVWLLQILSSRPRGRVTTLLALGLAGVALGSWADCLDEFFSLGHAVQWDNWLESTLSPLGMLTLTAGLYFWRQEQFSLNEQLHKRERLFREHRAFDRLTQLANAEYLRRQIALERERRPDAPCALVLLDIDRFHAINREHGQAEGDRLLQALGHLLLLNLRNDDLLCRYAGDRFAVLLPETGQAEADRIAAHLRAVVGQLAWHTRAEGRRLALSARVACAVADTDAERLLAALNAALEPAAAPLAPAGAA